MTTDYERPGVTTFQVRAEIFIAASPETVYATVSDLGRSAEWSPECRGGTWIKGTPSTVGAVFEGTNLRGADAVPWAPVIRGTWSTLSEVVEAVPGSVFRWIILTSAGEPQESTWSFEISPTAGGSHLVHHYRLGRLTEGLSKIFASLDEPGRERFVTEWNAKLAADVERTVAGIKRVIEGA
ncbi:SRPBCC family protein [Streptomyces roseirectus]|uniref:SRPBCC family protein n=1 Tax=Streptomyces roseirectus TaxID=2768066 RepID=A0A7H0IMR0_9ACTN|nr:SRPBCC family protein [Streptomyces roseirectus]QNP74076.1 SRPBCC family protein [Streptomyces roseirectus]